MVAGMYRLVSEMEPLLPEDRTGELAELAFRVGQGAAALGGLLPSVSRAAVSDLLRPMNSYYSNLIEGHNTHPLDIERALRNDYSSDAASRALQLEGRAHVEVQRAIEDRLGREPTLNVCSPEFLCWIHREFYARMPDEFLTIPEDQTAARFEPGALRERDVQVGRHVPPAHDSVPDFLRRFAEFYQPERFPGTTKVIAAAAAHHRLTWIHPFPDGNGRVARLFTDSYVRRISVDGHGLWAVTRGLARHRPAYLTALAEADHPRGDALDGRGNLSDRGLHQFCRFFLSTAVDQIRFMSELLDLAGLERRITVYVEQRAARRGLPAEAAQVLCELLRHGELARGEMARVTGKPERTARRVLSQLLAEELVRANSAKGSVRLHFPAKVLGYWFPMLYPEGIDES